MSRAGWFLPLVLAACAPDYLLGGGKDTASAPLDSDVALPLDTDPPRHHRPKDTDLPVDSAPPQDDTLPTDTDAPPAADTDTAPPVATYSMYAHTNDTLYAVDPASSQVQRIGRFRTAGGAVWQMVDIAIDLAGHLYAGSLDATSSGGHTIFSVDPTTARIQRVCDVPLTLTGLTFLSDGRLVAGADHALTVIDLAAGCTHQELYRNNNWTTSGDVVGLPDGKLYWTITGSGNDVVVRVDPVAGSATTVGTTGVTQIFGLGYDEPSGVLYGFSNASGHVHTIDPNTARTTRIPGATTLSWWGATTNPVVW